MRIPPRELALGLGNLVTREQGRPERAKRLGDAGQQVRERFLRDKYLSRWVEPLATLPAR